VLDNGVDEHRGMAVAQTVEECRDVEGGHWRKDT
jgi:hypothetical protein